MTPGALDAIHADPWARELVDLATLNAPASGAVEEAVEKLRREAASGSRQLRSTSLVILGPPGAGKTHLFARLRRRIGPRAVFVHVRPLVHAELSMRFVLSEVVRQLAFFTPQGTPQVDAMVGSVLGALSDMGNAYPSTVLTMYRTLAEAEREHRLDAALEKLLESWPEADETYLARLLRVPFRSGPTSRALMAWLSGRDCDAVQLERIGAKASLDEERALPALQTLSLVAALGAPLVLVFDQLENLIDSDGAGPRLRAYAHLASECVDVLRGTVLVHLALDSEWERGIESSFNASQRSRIVMRRELLSLPRAAEREELLRLWLERVPEPHDAFPWPLGERRFERLRREPGITPRLLLVAFRRALDGEPDDVESPDASPASDARAASDAPVSAPSRDVSSEWQAQLSAARDAVLAAGEAREPLDAARLADGLLATGRFIAGLRITAQAKPPATLQLESDSARELLALVQESNHRSVGAALTKLTALARSEHVVVVRERARELPPTWRETRSKRSALLGTGRARWLDLDTEDAARVLALAALLQSARSGEVTDERGAQVNESEVAEWVTGHLEVASWPICAGLRAPGHDAEATADLSKPDSDAPASEATAARPVIAGAALATLRRLRIASLDRLIREVLRVAPESSRASVIAELESAGERVRWFGRSIVYLRGEP